MQVKHVYSDPVYNKKKLVIPPNMHPGMENEIGIYSKLEDNIAFNK